MLLDPDARNAEDPSMAGATMAISKEHLGGRPGFYWILQYRGNQVSILRGSPIGGSIGFALNATQPFDAHKEISTLVSLHCACGLQFGIGVDGRLYHVGARSGSFLTASS